MFRNLSTRSSNVETPPPEARKLSYLVISPDPQNFEPLKPIGTGNKSAYFIKFGDGPKERVEKYATANPHYNFAHNDGKIPHGKILEKEVLQKQLKLHNVGQHDQKRTEWYRFEDLGQKDGQGRNLRALLLVLLEKFPSYDFETEEGRKKAEDEITALLTPVAIARTDETATRGLESTGTQPEPETGTSNLRNPRFYLKKIIDHFL